MNNDIDDITRKINDITGKESLRPVPKTGPQPDKPKKYQLYIGTLIIVAIINTGLYYIYNLGIHPAFPQLPDISWIAMLSVFIFYHVFTLGVFNLFTIINAFSKK